MIKNVFFVAVMMTCFKALGFLKQALIAYYYGATADTDYYFIANGFVLGCISCCVGALIMATVAVYTNLRIKEGNEKATKLISGLIEISIPITLGVVILVVLFAPYISRVLAPGLDQNEISEISKYIRALSPSIMILSIQFTMSAVLDSNKSFFAPRMETFIYNSFGILACIFVSRLLGIFALVFAQIAAVLVFSVFLMIAARKYFKYEFVRIKDIPKLKETRNALIPLLIASSAIYINELVDKAITSGLGEGATSHLYYAQTLNQFVTMILVTNLANMMLSDFSEKVAKNDIQEVKMRLFKVNNLLLCILLAVSVFVVICAKDIVTLVFFRGNFTVEAVEYTSITLIGYAIGFVFVALNEMVARGLYAFHDMKRVMVSSIVTILFNIVFSLVLSKQYGIIGVSLGTCFAALVGVIINLFLLKKFIKDYPFRNHIISFFKCIPVTLLLLVYCYIIQKTVAVGPLVRFVLSGFGLVAYGLILYLIRIPEIRELFGKIIVKVKN